MKSKHLTAEDVQHPKSCEEKKQAKEEEAPRPNYWTTTVRGAQDD